MPPIPAFNYWCRENPNFMMNNRNKFMKIYLALEDKSQWEEKAAKDLKRYESEMEKWTEESEIIAQNQIKEIATDFVAATSSQNTFEIPGLSNDETHSASYEDKPKFSKFEIRKNKFIYKSQIEKATTDYESSQ